MTGYETELVVSQWDDLQLRVDLYRKHVGHETRRNFQLDFFAPDAGHYEYSAVATSMPLGPAALSAFAGGRGAQGKNLFQRRNLDSLTSVVQELPWIRRL